MEDDAAIQDERAVKFDFHTGIEMWIRDAATYPAKPPAAIRAWADAAASSAAQLRLLIEEYGVEVAAARDRARAAPRRDSGATYCGKRPGYRCRGHGSEKRCHPDASCN